MAAALRGLVHFLFSPFVGREESLYDHPLDNEFIYTLESRVIPDLPRLMEIGEALVPG